jgi:hypothetical protein
MSEVHTYRRPASGGPVPLTAHDATGPAASLARAVLGYGVQLTSGKGSQLPGGLLTAACAQPVNPQSALRGGNAGRGGDALTSPADRVE